MNVSLWRITASFSIGVILLMLPPSACGQAPRKSSVQALVRALKSKDPKVRASAANALRGIGPPAAPAVPALVEALKSKDLDERASAAYALGGIGPPAVSALAKALGDGDPKVRASAAYALGGIWPPAVPALAKALGDGDPNVRASAAYTLGEIGPPAAPAVPALVEALKSKDLDEHAFAANALGEIGNALALNAPNLKDGPLAIALHATDKAESLLIGVKANKNVDASELQNILGAIQGANAALNKEYNDRQWWNRIPKWIKGNPGYVFRISLIPLSWLTTLAMLWLRPLMLLRVNTILKQVPDVSIKGAIVGVSLAIRYVTLAGFFEYHDRVLNAWVSEYAVKARENLRSIKTFEARRVYVDPSGVFPGQYNFSVLREQFDKDAAKVLIHGDGGTGKTTLACQMAFWALSDDDDERLCRTHRMMPVFLEANLPGAQVGNSAALLSQITDYLKKLIGGKAPPSNELIKMLLEKRRLLLIMDGLSERDEATRQSILSSPSALNVNALVVTSRRAENFEPSSPLTVEIGKLKGTAIAAFIEGYITQSGKRDLFTDDAAFFGEITRFTELVGSREITALLAGLYARYMMESKENAATDRPKSVPELMDFYVAEMCSKGNELAYTEYLVQRLIRKIAWTSLHATLKPKEMPIADIASALTHGDDAITLPAPVTDPNAVLDYFIDRLRLLERRGSASENATFALDPVSEYLAARYLVAHGFKSDEAKWHEFLIQATAKNGHDNSAAGFIRALADVCDTKGPEGPIPSWLPGEIRTRFASIFAPTPKQIDNVAVSPQLP